MFIKNSNFQFIKKKCLHFLQAHKLRFIGQFVLKVSSSCVVWGERGVIFLFSAKRPPRKGELSSYLRRAGQRRCFQRVF